MGEGEFTRTRVDGQGPAYYIAQPLQENEILLVAPRAGYGRTSFNANVFSTQGHFLRKFALGDGVDDVGTTQEGLIWTTYTDQARECGLVNWAPDGTRLHEYQEGGHYGTNGLNIVSGNEVWTISPGYHEIHLVQMKDNRPSNYWEVQGVWAAAVWRHIALFQPVDINSTQYPLCELGGNHQVTELARFEFTDEHGKIIRPDQIVIRGSQIVMLTGKTLYRFYVHQLQDR